MSIRPRIRRWLRRRPKTSSTICPTCGQPLTAQIARDTTPARQTMSADSHRLAAREGVAVKAFQAVNQVDALRRDLAGTDPVKDRLLGQIEADFIQSVAETYRRLDDGGAEEPG